MLITRASSRRVSTIRATNSFSGSGGRLVRGRQGGLKFVLRHVGELLPGGSRPTDQTPPRSASSASTSRFKSARVSASSSSSRITLKWLAPVGAGRLRLLDNAGGALQPDQADEHPLQRIVPDFLTLQLHSKWADLGAAEAAADLVPVVDDPGAAPINAPLHLTNWCAGASSKLRSN